MGVHSPEIRGDRIQNDHDHIWQLSDQFFEPVKISLQAESAMTLLFVADRTNNKDPGHVGAGRDQSGSQRICDVIFRAEPDDVSSISPSCTIRPVIASGRPCSQIGQYRAFALAALTS